MRKILNLIMLFMAVILAAISLTACATANYPSASEKLFTAENSVLNANSPNPYENPDDLNTSKDGTVFSTNEMTGYYLELNLKGLSAKCWSHDFISKYANTFKDGKTSTITAVITFMDIEYNGLPVFVSAPVSITTLRNSFISNNRKNVTFNTNLCEADNNSIRLPAAYYNYFKYEIEENGASLQNIGISFLWDGNKAAGLEGFHKIKYKLYTKDIPADSDDPKSPNFELGSWAGLIGKMIGSGDTIPTWVIVLAVLGAVVILSVVIAAIVKIVKIFI